MTSGTLRGALAGAAGTAALNAATYLDMALRARPASESTTQLVEETADRASISMVSSALAGAATGARSLTGLAALTLAARPGAAAQPDRTLSRPWAKAVAGVLAATEIGLDKLPSAPRRLTPPGLASRLAGAAAAGVIIARRAPVDAGAVNGPAQVGACVAVAAGSAVGAAWIGVRWRAWASARLGRDWIGAVVEDAVAVTLAAAASTMSR